MPSLMEAESLRELQLTLEQYGQSHLLLCWDSLSEVQQTQLIDDLRKIDYPLVTRYFNSCCADISGSSGNSPSKLDDLIEPLPADVKGSVTLTDDVRLHSYESSGLTEISEGRVAVLLLAGGQGTRLDVPYPKGMYDVGLPSGKTLYQLQAERIVKIQQLANERNGKHGVVPWYIMTSEHTKEQTKTFFSNHDFFGLSAKNVHVFEQHTLPCMTLDGKIILESPSVVSKAPDGNGGLYRAMGNQKVIDDMIRRGVQYVHVYCVDNILVKMADPVFIGFCIQKGAECGAKVVEKSRPTEAVGVVCKVGRVYQVVEYSEISPHTSERRNADNSLTFNAGNICNHFFTVDFLQKIISEKEDLLKHHVAKKKIAYCSLDGQTVNPTQPNGIKMEKFVFDVFQFARKFAVWEVKREDEFAPLKNAPGALADTPEASCRALYDVHRRWILKAGGQFISCDDLSDLPDECSTPITNIPSTNGVHCGSDADCHNCFEKDKQEHVICEISPLVSYFGEGLEVLVRNKSFRPPVLLKTADEKGSERIINAQQISRDHS